MYPLVSILSLAMVCGHNQYQALSATPPCFAEALRRGRSPLAKAVKNSVLSKFFGNCVPNFREWVADSKNVQTKNQTKKE